LIALFAVSIFCGTVATVGGWAWLQSLMQAPVPIKIEKTVVVVSGSGLNRIANQLEREGVIGSALAFRFYARLAGFAPQLKAGEYRFSPGSTARDVLAKLVTNDVVVRFLTIPEGMTTEQIVSLIKVAEGLVGDVPRNIPQGALLPETYGYSLGETRSALVGRMTEALSVTIDDLWLDRAEGLPFDTRDEALVLASIVEKETAVAKERSRVAAVFVNRLRRGMRLQSDPTVAFGIESAGPMGRPLRRADLDDETPFNTYKIDGLPPGPICHPGRESIAAALNPAQTRDLYFVADGSGGHAFAETLSDHNRNVARWRQIQRQRGER